VTNKGVAQAVPQKAPAAISASSEGTPRRRQDTPVARITGQAATWLPSLVPLVQDDDAGHVG
jgi:hypothetical protein